MDSIYDGRLRQVSQMNRSQFNIGGAKLQVDSNLVCPLVSGEDSKTIFVTFEASTSTLPR